MLNSVKDSIPRELRSNIVYKFTCARCNSCYLGESRRHFSTRVREHLKGDKSSHIYKHLAKSPECKEACSDKCFEIIDQGTEYTIKLKEAMHIKWQMPSLNQQVLHVNLSLNV